MTDSLVPAIVHALEGLYNKGCPIPSPGNRETLAVVGLRRVHRLARRHRRPQRLSKQDVIRDLTKGLISACEPDPELVGPLAADYKCVAETILMVIEAESNPAMPGSTGWIE